MKRRGIFIFLMIMLIPVFLCSSEKSRFTLELFYGAAKVNPVDLNLRPESDLTLRNFSYEQAYIWLSRRGVILGYKAAHSGDFPDISNASLGGFRLRYRLNGKVDISFGYKRVGRSETETPASTYTVVDRDHVVTKETITYHHYTMSAAGHCPAVGIHWRPEPDSPFLVETFLTAGLLFGQCAYSFHRVYTKNSVDGVILDTGNWQVEEKGHGIGLSLEAGGRMGFKFLENVEFFFEGGYSYQGLVNPSGKGSEMLNGESKSWEGEWAIKEHFVNSYTGNYMREFPSNYWEDQAHLRVRDFILNLSGLFVRAGISYRF